MRKILLIILSCGFAVTATAQFNLGMTIGTSIFGIDKNPTTNDSKYKGNLISMPGSNISSSFFIKLGNDNYSFYLMGNGTVLANWNWKEYKGLGSISYGAMAKIAITPWENPLNEETTIGFSFGGGWERMKTEVFTRPIKYRDMQRNWYNLYYGYLSFTCSDNDFYVKYGMGKDKAWNFSVGWVSYFKFLK